MTRGAPGAEERASAAEDSRPSGSPQPASDRLEWRVAPDPGPICASIGQSFAFRQVHRVHELRAEPELFGRPISQWRNETRSELGLAADRPLVLTGHQAEIWHAGVLAKWFLADACAQALQGSPVELLVDQDVNHGERIAYPALREGGLHGLRRAELATVPLRHGDLPTALAPPIGTATPSATPVPLIQERLDAIITALHEERQADSLATQLLRANSRLRAPFLPAFSVVRATALLQTSFGRVLVDAMRRDPGACIRAYNAALAADPRVARPLELERGELPLWRLVSGRRERVLRAAEGSSIESLVPRAFLMTAFARLVVCDLFIHGTGGERYERVTEEWIHRWLGVPLAPMVVATATLRLPLESFVGDAPIRSASELRRREWDPDLAPFEQAPSPRKRALLAAINAAPRRSPERRRLHRELLAYLDQRRQDHAVELADLAGEVSASRDRSRVATLARLRLWPWPLHAPERIREIATAMTSAMTGAMPSPSGSSAAAPPVDQPASGSGR